MDSLTVGLISGIGAASLTVVGGLIGAWIQGRREHDRWLRERRFEAYTKFMRHQHQITLMSAVLDNLSASIKKDGSNIPVIQDKLAAAQERINESERQLPEATTELYILAAGEVEQAARAYLEARVTGKNVPSAESRFLRAMRESLGISAKAKPKRRPGGFRRSDASKTATTGRAHSLRREQSAG